MARGMKRVILALVSALLLLSLSGCMLDQTQLRNVQTFDSNEVEYLSIEYGSENVSVFYSESDEIVVKEYLSSDNSSYYANITSNGPDVIVKSGDRPRDPGFNSYVEVCLPSTWSGRLSITTASGSINVKPALDLSQVSFTTASGQISTSAISCDSLSVTSDSGKIDIPSVTGKVYATTATSSISIDSINGSGYLSSRTGAIQARFKNIYGDITVRNSTGKVRLDLPRNARFHFKAETVDGTIKTPFREDEIQRSDSKQVVAYHGGANALCAVDIHTENGAITVELE